MRTLLRLFGILLIFFLTPLLTPAQTQRLEEDPRNIAPTVGSGGAVGGPTGLFTIYDGQTLRRGEVSYSFAFSNYDRDPGNVDISEVSSIVQFGVTDRIELFLNTNLYRGIKVNNPQNLSGFYLPNTLVLITNGQAGSGPAVVLAPFNNLGISGAVFRPANNQPFVQFPFVGQPSGDFRFAGTPPFSGTLGVMSSGGGNFGAAGSFPGIGSAFGSILPGIVTSTALINGIITPTVFTVPPSYLPDAPFINRRYGDATHNSYTIGAKIRLTKPNTNFGIGVVPFYRFYADKGDNAGAFDQLQRGASPGGSLGDFGLSMFIDGRLGRRVNLAANFGYTLNSNPRSTFGGETVTMLDRPDEFMTGVGVDISVNNFIQLISEFRATRYVAGRTPNALENHPADLIVGFRYHITREMGIGVGYRRHLNQQNGSIFSGFSSGFAPSTNANGLVVQFWRRERDVGRKPKTPPTFGPPIPRLPNPDTITLPCGASFEPDTGASCPLPQDFAGQVDLDAILPVTDDEAEQQEAESNFKFEWTTNDNKGRIIGEGASVKWDVTGLAQGVYGAEVKIYRRDGDKLVPISINVFTLRVKSCDCVPIATPCTTVVEAAGPQTVTEGTQAKFTVTVQGALAGTSPSYTWVVEPPEAKVLTDLHSQTVIIDTTGLGGETVTASVTVDGLGPTCPNTARAQASVEPIPIKQECRLFDKYGPIMYNDEKARLDNFAIQLQGDPRATGHIIGYRGGTGGRNIGTKRSRVRGDVCATYRLDRARKYLESPRGGRGLTSDRLSTLDGGSMTESTVELWVCPANVGPQPSPDLNVQSSGETCITQGVTVTVDVKRRRSSYRQRKGNGKHRPGAKSRRRPPTGRN